MSAMRPARDLWPNGEPSIIFLKPPRAGNGFRGRFFFGTNFGLQTLDFGLWTGPSRGTGLGQKK